MHENVGHKLPEPQVIDNARGNQAQNIREIKPTRSKSKIGKKKVQEIGGYTRRNDDLRIRG